MVLREERNEENQSLWSKRFERERLDLSASVEAALVVDSTLERQWLDEFDEQDASPLATDGTVSVSPQLSRQSSLLPLVMPERPPVTVTTDASPAVPSSAAEHTEQQSQRTGILARLARRFTSSLTAVDISEKQESQPPQSVSEQKKPLLQQMEAYQAASRGVNTSVESAEYSDVPLVRVIDAISIHSTNVVKEDVSPHKKSSLRGNRKVRLETTEQPVVSRVTKAQKRETSELPLPLSEDMLTPQWSFFAGESTTNETQIAVSRRPFFGSGVCASGQGDAMVTCTHITAASVVLVTLTSNPGPVVVQYVSLQPRTGFTLHLTAPVAERTTFNYIVL